MNDMDGDPNVPTASNDGPPAGWRRKVSQLENRLAIGIAVRSRGIWLPPIIRFALAVVGLALRRHSRWLVRPRRRRARANRPD